jgi:hypothetical protein
MAKAPKTPLSVEALKHFEATRKNIPTAEYQSVMQKNEQAPVRIAYERPLVGLADEKINRSRDLDPQLVWRGKDQQDWSDLVVHAPPVYIQEKVHPKVLIDDLRRQSEKSPSPLAGEGRGEGDQFDLFADFNGLPDDSAKTEFYQHDAHWANRMILGDSLQVMASLAEREGLRGQVQCIYFDPPYGIKFNSNFQWSTTSRDVKDGNTDHITREPEQVKAFRDTWRDGIHSYLTYLRDRLTVARDLLTDSGSIFVQIGDENVHRVRAVMDEVFGEPNFISQISVQKTSGQTSDFVAGVQDFILFYARNADACKFRKVMFAKPAIGSPDERAAMHSNDHRPRRPGPRPHLRLRHHRLCRRTVGPPLDHPRHLPRRPGPGPRPHHGRPLPLLPARRQPRRPDQGSRVTRTAPSSQPTRGNLRHGFVYERVPHITLKSIANNAEIDVIWDKWQAKLEPLREQLNQALGMHWQEWEIPRDLTTVIPAKAATKPARTGPRPPPG